MRFWKKSMIWIPSDLLDGVDLLGALSGAETVQLARKRVMLLAVRELLGRERKNVPELDAVLPKDLYDTKGTL